MSSESEYIFTTTTTTTSVSTTTLAPTFEALSTTLGETFVHYLNYLAKIPGGDLLLWYIKASYKNDPIRSLFELALFVFGVHYFLRSKRKENKSELVKLSKRDVDELIDEWTPTDLVEEVSDIEAWNLKSIPIIKGSNGAFVELQNLTKKSNVVNFCSLDYLNLSTSKELRDASKIAINTSGVGACSAPNFYGTQDFHIRLEEDLSEFFGTDRALLYGQDFVTASSVLPAFVKRGDLCIVDSGVNLAIQKALIVGRCDVEWYNHNDMDHLETILSELKPTLDKQKPIKRRFIVTEALFSNDGSMANLSKLVELKNKYQYRLFLDESNSIGVIGKTGRGLAEYYNIPREEISITVGTFASSIGSSGGFCVGAVEMIHHQKLSSLAYVFSASLPPYCAKVASQALQEIAKTNSSGDSILISKLQENAQFVHEHLAKIVAGSKFIELVSSDKSPAVHLQLKQSYRESLKLPNYYGSPSFLSTGQRAKYNNEFDAQYNLEKFLLQKIVDYILVNFNILISRSKNLLEHENLPILRPHLLIYINATVSTNELQLLTDNFEEAVNAICSEVSNEDDLINLENEIRNY